MLLLEAPSLIEVPHQVSLHISRNNSTHKIEAPDASYRNFMKFIHTCTIKHGTCCSKSQWWPPKPVSLLVTCLNCHMSKHTISVPMMPKMARNRSALHDVLAQGASNRDITVLIGAKRTVKISWIVASEDYREL